MANKRIKHRLIVEILFDEPVSEDDAVRIARKPLRDLGTMVGHWGSKNFCITGIKNLTRVKASWNQEFCDQTAKQFAEDMADYADPTELVEFAEVFETWAKAFRDKAKEE